jgi:hypothetical protein
MKLFVDGTLEGSPEELAAYKHIDAALAAKNKRAETPKRKGAFPSPEDEEVKISNKLSATLKYIAENGSSSGVAYTEVAAGMGIQPGTAQWRLGRLVALGLAYRPSPGFYMPGAKP